MATPQCILRKQASLLFGTCFYWNTEDLANVSASPRVPQAENQWLHLSLITDLKKCCKEVFPTVEYAYTTIPTYPSGQIGFMVCCKDPDRDVKVPLREWKLEEEEKLCRYYNKEIHRASFVLPSFARRALR